MFDNRKLFFFQEKKNAQDNTNGEVKPTKKDKKENLKKAEVKNGTDTNHSLHNLSQQLDVAEEAQVRKLLSSLQVQPMCTASCRPSSVRTCSV